MGLEAMDSPTPAVTDILVIDYDDGVRSSTANILRQEGHGVIEADRGEVALERLQRGQFRLVLLDPSLPLLRGADVLESLTNPPPVIVVSSYPVEEVERQRLGDAVVAYLEKPVPPTVLISVVQAVLDEREE